MKGRIRLFTEILLSDGFNPDAEFEILTTAKQIDSRYGEFKYSKADLEEIAENFNEDAVGVEIAVDQDHGERNEGMALAWLVPKSARVAPSSKLKGEFSLYMKMHRFTPKGEDAVKTGALRYFSVELQHKMERIMGGAKKIFKNVLRGLALTNRPVIKDMLPTFSENNNFTNQHTMLKKLFYSLAAKDSVTSEELKNFSEKADEAVANGDATEEEVEAQKAELEENVDDEAGKGNDDEAADAVKAAEAATAKVLAEAKAKGGSLSLSEVEGMIKDAVAPAMKQLNDLLTDARGGKLSEKVSALTLSESNHVGFKKDSQDKILSFVKKLTNDLAAEYFELHEGIIAAVDLSEYGVDGAVELKAGDPNFELNEKAAELADKEGMSLAEARKQILNSNKDLADRIMAAEEA